MPYLDLPSVRLDYKLTGEGTPLVLVHGSAVDQTTWDNVVPKLSTSAQVITYDRRGYGNSEHRPVRDHRLHVDDLIAFLEQVVEGPANVLGWSSGGNVSIAAATKRPDLFKKLIVLEAPFHGLRHMNADVLSTMLKLKFKQLMGKPEEAVEVFLRFGSALRAGGNTFDNLPPEAQETLRRYWGPVLAEWDPHPYGIMHEHISNKALSDIDLPMTWMLGGEGAPWMVGIHDTAKRHKPEIKTVVIPGAGHLAHVDAEQAFVEAVLAEI